MIFVCGVLLSTRVDYTRLPRFNKFSCFFPLRTTTTTPTPTPPTHSSRGETKTTTAAAAATAQAVHHCYIMATLRVRLGFSSASCYLSRRAFLYFTRHSTERRRRLRPLFLLLNCVTAPSRPPPPLSISSFIIMNPSPSLCVRSGTLEQD